MKKKYIQPEIAFEELDEDLMGNGITGSTENKNMGTRKDNENADNPIVNPNEEPDPYDPFA